HVRETVRFADSVARLADAGVSAFVELGPDGVLSAMAAESAPEHAVIAPALRKDHDEETALVTALARLHTAGVTPRWETLFAGTGARQVDLPTYAFERRWFWPDTSGPSGDVRGAGLESVEHPLLGAGAELAGSDGFLFTSRLSVRSQPWLADHVVRGQVIVPGAALVELAIRAADEAGCGRIEELTMAAPVVLPEQGALQLQLRVGPDEDSGHRSITIHSRPENDAELPWAQHAVGLLAAEELLTTFDTAVWPPADAEPVEITGFYERLAESGFDYGSAFRGLRRAWRLGDEVFAEVVLPEEVETSGFGLHPALLDASLHALGFAGEQASAGVVPFSWRGISLHASGASQLRVRMSVAADGSMGIALADSGGAQVASVDSLVVREFAPAELDDAQVSRDSLFELDWVPVAASTNSARPAWDVLGPDPVGLPGPERANLASTEAGVVLAPVAHEPVDDVAGAARRATSRVLGLVQEWLVEERFAGS
ncbi:polyketide synthase dehydratase domain-containing protein, partial [Saccharopolyspora halophila]|uniref:polyketide synthase dehydratase domain-containing protein n=1 Tax=Saccharopolyspora halophila TaxID=405551 RepID=UPI0031DE6CF2